MNALDHPVPVTLFADFAAAAKTEERFTPHEIAEGIRTVTAPTKEALPWLKLARFGDKRTEKNSLRHNANVLSISGVEADYDGGEVSEDIAILRLEAAGLLGVVYTSPSHTEAVPRWRVLCPFSQELPPDQRNAMLNRLNGVFGGIFASESWTLSQSYYYGSVNNNPAHCAELVDGTPIDLCGTLDAGAIGPARVEPAAIGLLPEWADDPAAVAAATGYLQSVRPAIQNNGGDNHTWQTAAEVHDRGVTEATCFELMLKHFNERCEPPWAPEELRDKVANGYRHAKNAFGCKHPRVALGDVSNMPMPPAPLPAPPSLPIIQVMAGVAALADQAETAILASGIPIFQRGADLVRPLERQIGASGGRTTTSAVLQSFSRAALLDLLSRAARWQRFDARKKDLVATDPPSQLADVLLSRAGRCAFPTVAGIITTPTLRPDGTVLDEPGYDPATRLFLAVTPGLILPAGVESADKGAAERGLADINGLLEGFPFVSGVSRAVALSAIITAVVRGALSVAPLHAFKSPTPGSGKSYLADIVSAIANGRKCPVISAGEGVAELEKRLTGLLLEGAPLISIDNANGELGSDLLCQAVERRVLKLRALGRSAMAEVENQVTILATGNNLRLKGDLVRRTIGSALDAGVERPELRVFAFDPVQRVLADRARYVAACLTITRAYFNAGSPGKLPAIASFGDWSDMVRSALVWLGCADPAESMNETREDDPVVANLRDVLAGWERVIGLDKQLPVRDLATHAIMAANDQDFFAALSAVAGEPKGGLSNHRLGNWLADNRGRVVSGLCLRRASKGAGNHVACWECVRADAGGG